MRRLLLIAAALVLGLAPSAAPAQVYGDASSLVNYWYRAYLGRDADASSYGWTNELNQGTPPDQVLAQILGSTEFYNRVGATPEGFITRLYANILQRSATPGEVDFWVRRMYTEDRTAIADEILTQNPGNWVGRSTAIPATPPTVVVPIEGHRYRDWERDRHGDWDRHHDIHEYRRPDVNRYHRDEHRDGHRDEHRDRRR